MKNLFEIAKAAISHPYYDDPIKMKIYDILHKKYTESFENKEMKPELMFDHVAYASAKMKWHEYLKSLGMKFDKKNGILDPSSHLEWQHRYIEISEEIMDKILTLGLP